MRIKFLPRLSACLLGVGLLARFSYADSVPQNLGNGLQEMVTKAQRGFRTNALVLQPTVSSGLQQSMIYDDLGRVLVDIHLRGDVPFENISAALEKDTAVKVSAQTKTFQNGVIEAYLKAEDVVRWAKASGIRSISAALRPGHYVGKVTSQGFIQHKVNQIAGTYDGTGIKVGVLSDSFDTAKFNTASPPLTTADQDIASGDLPGLGNPLGNTTPVTILEDDLLGEDEGRAMIQIIHDLAPKAKLAFASADAGEVQFANNIVALREQFGADVIVDDVFYFDEPFFQDGIIAQAVDQAVAEGAHYFSSAGNQSPTEAYASELRRLPKNGNTPASLAANTNLDLSTVPASLYTGGFHNFEPGGRNIAQLVHIANGDSLALDWNDATQTKPSQVISQIYSGSGDLESATATQSFQFNNPGNDQVRLDVFSADGKDDVDVIVDILDPAGNLIVEQDTGAGESVSTFLTTAGTYTARVRLYVAPNGAINPGAYTVKGYLTDGKPLVTTQLNLLIFDQSGKYLGAIANNAIANNKPVQVLGRFALPTNFYQIAVGFGNVPQGPNPANQVRYAFLNPADSYVVSYASVLTPSTFGHSAARGAISVGAYSPFRPYIPEDFTARGPVTVYFDADGNRLPRPEVRIKPEVSACDGVNTTFFFGTTSRSGNGIPSFFGTSASAPHAAAIGALVLQSRGGPGSVDQDSLRKILEQSTFLHDLTGYESSAIAFTPKGILYLAVSGSDEFSSQIDPNRYSVYYFGFGSVKQLSINLKGANPGGGNIYNAYPGEVFDTRPPVVEFDATTLNGGLPFTLGNSVGIGPGDVTATYAQPAPVPSVAGQFYQLNLAIRPGALKLGSVLKFGIARHEQHSAWFPSPTGTGGGDSRRGESADLLGEDVLIPSGQVVGPGALVTGTLDDGTKFSTYFHNLIGLGYGGLDGYGFIDAARAVQRYGGYRLP